MEETFIASRCLGQEIYVFKNKLSYEKLEYFRPENLDRTRPPIIIIFKGANFLNGHFMALIPKDTQTLPKPSQPLNQQMEIEKIETVVTLPQTSTGPSNSPSQQVKTGAPPSQNSNQQTHLER